MGDARAKYAAHVPLIGIAPWGIVQGRTLFDDEVWCHGIYRCNRFESNRFESRGADGACGSQKELVDPEFDRIEYKKVAKKELEKKVRLLRFACGTRYPGLIGVVPLPGEGARARTG